jgi:hypothetical protein
MSFRQVISFGSPTSRYTTALAATKNCSTFSLKDGQRLLKGGSEDHIKRPIGQQAYWHYDFTHVEALQILNGTIQVKERDSSTRQISVLRKIYDNINGTFVETPSNLDSCNLILSVVQRLLLESYVFLSLWPSLSVGSTGDKEPLINAWVDWSGSELLVGWYRRKLVRGDTAWGMLDCKVGAKEM